MPGDDRPLLQATIDRIAPLVPPERILIVTSVELEAATREVAASLPSENILAEPTGRNTAPCIGWAASHIRRRDPDGLLMVLPADHHIADSATFLDVMQQGLDACGSGALVTVGIRPSRPETGYGYLELGEETSRTNIFEARRFVEKPNRQRAEQFLAAGNFLWNSGMFFFSATAILDAMANHLPGLSSTLEQYDKAAKTGSENDLVAKTYGELPSVSIDHGVMEKAERVLVIPGDFGWSDLGSWLTAWELATRDDCDNSISGPAITVDSSGNFVQTQAKKLVALVGVHDLVIVDTPDAILIVPRDRAQEVRTVVDALKARGSEGW